ncbi:MAG: A24 family peptidase [Candidatus Dormibacteraeota bacterium]|nr:A24 family peptidase [Candidatus Dormibacteraeota bacterium]
MSLATLPHPQFGLLWLVAGVALGGGIRAANVQLARWEGLDPGRLGWQRWGPLVLTGLLFGVFGGRLGWGRLLLIQSLWVVVLVQIVFFDLEHRLILDRVLLPAAVMALALSFFTPYLTWRTAIVSGLGCALLFLVIYVVGGFVFKAEALGLGDVKFGALMGLVTGFPMIAFAVLSGVISAGVLALILVAVRVLTMKDGVAYGPYLALGTLLALFRLALAAP